MKSMSVMVRHALAAIAILVVSGLTGAFASTPYSETAFKAAQASGSPILVEVHASWCSTCKAQTPIINELTSQEKFKNLKVFRVDFDAQKADLQKLRVQSQSTLIVFKGGAEIGRSVGDTRRASIAALLEKGI